MGQFYKAKLKMESFNNFCYLLTNYVYKKPYTQEIIISNTYSYQSARHWEKPKMSIYAPLGYDSRAIW